jgi:sporulation protein YlmC with PRC-barrel domain
LDNVTIWRTSTGTTNPPAAADDITFNVKIDGKTVATIDNPKFAAKFADAKDDADFSPIAVEAGKSVNVEVYAVVFASAPTSGNLEYKIGFKGKDDAGNDAGNIDKAMAPMAFVNKATVNVASNDSMKKQDIVLANKDQNLATFIVKPSNKDGTAKLETLEFDLSANLATLVTTTDAEDFFEVAVGNKNGETDHTYKISGTKLTVEDIDIDISEETKVAVNFKEKLGVSASKGATSATYATWTDTSYCLS